MTPKSKPFGPNIMLRWGMWALERLMKWDERLSVQTHTVKHSDEFSEIMQLKSGIHVRVSGKRICDTTKQIWMCSISRCPPRYSASTCNTELLSRSIMSLFERWGVCFNNQKTLFYAQLTNLCWVHKPLSTIFSWGREPRWIMGILGSMALWPECLNSYHLWRLYKVP